MERGSHWWNEPPLWAWIVMVVGAVALAVMLPFGLNRSAPASDVAEERPEATTSSGSASPTPSGTAEATPTGATPTEPAPDGDGPTIAVIGDGYTSGTPQGGLGPDGWPALLEDRIEGADVEVAAERGAGYVATGAGGLTFGGLAGTLDLDGADVVVVLGSRDDGPGIADQVATAAGELFAAVPPDARLVVIGPIWPEESPPAGARNNRDVLRDEAEAAGATFVDPLEEAWLVGEPDLLGAGGVYPNDGGHAYLADRVEVAVQGALTG